MENYFTVCIFCGSSEGYRPSYCSAAEQLGTVLGRSGIDIIYGGGRTGLMGKVADAALAAGARVTGVIPTFLKKTEIAHQNLSELIVTDCMHTRKRIMYDRANLFVSLPGGVGTLDETVEVMAWVQLNIFRKKIILLNIESYWEPFVDLIRHSYDEGFSKEENMSIITLVESIDSLLKIINESRLVHNP
ncbi:MAG: TIGR00730 family Rossman fold protein [Rhodospirillaceae bacterium]|nr:TIGR00730 family Rossman fold protein [Rhodospirillaceae bacterium]|tara:strand:- start:1880 stop:2446 length:567 start_codon:yes stop_codon:yes gene_type:complete